MIWGKCSRKLRVHKFVEFLESLLKNHHVCGFSILASWISFFFIDFPFSLLSWKVSRNFSNFSYASWNPSEKLWEFQLRETDLLMPPTFERNPNNNKWEIQINNLFRMMNKFDNLIHNLMPIHNSLKSPM